MDRRLFLKKSILTVPSVSLLAWPLYRIVKDSENIIQLHNQNKEVELVSNFKFILPENPTDHQCIKFSYLSVDKNQVFPQIISKKHTVLFQKQELNIDSCGCFRMAYEASSQDWYVVVV